MKCETCNNNVEIIYGMFSHVALYGLSPIMNTPKLLSVELLNFCFEGYLKNSDIPFFRKSCKENE